MTQTTEPTAGDQSRFQVVEIKGQFSTLNDHDKLNRHNRYIGAEHKKNQTNMAAMQLGKMALIEHPCVMTWHWYISTSHDPDNIAFAKKYILDGMVKAGKLENDNQTWILGFGGDAFIRVPKGEEKVLIEIEEYLS